jgi:hypothetical protein
LGPFHPPLAFTCAKERQKGRNQNLSFRWLASSTAFFGSEIVSKCFSITVLCQSKPFSGDMEKP